MIPLFFSVLLASIVATVFFRDLFSSRNIVDKPDNIRKKHKKPIPFGGGLSIILVFLTFIWLIELQTGFFTTGLITRTHLISLSFASLWIALIGYLDDKYQLRPKYSILGPIGAIIITLLGNFSVLEITNPFGGIFTITPFISLIGIIFWLLIIIYALKFLDGIDGLSSGTGTIAAFMIFLLASTETYFQPDIAIMSLITMATILGFFLINLSNNKVYLGEIGSVWIGYILAILSIISGSKLLTILLVLALPILDAIFVILRRLRLGKSIFTGDRLHLHHNLIDRGWSKYAILALYLGIATILGISSLLLSGWQKWLLFIIIFLIISLDFISNFYAKKV